MPDLMALYAFHAELGRIADSVSEPLLGEIRLQWWRDALQGAKGGGQTGHPVADRFAGTVKRHALADHEIAGMIDARIFDVSGDVMPDGQALSTYLNKTEGAVMRLSCTILGGGADGAVEEASRLAGQAYGRAQMLRGLAQAVAGGRLLLPAGDLQAAGVDVDGLLCGEGGAAWPGALMTFCDETVRLADAARAAVGALADNIKPAFLPLALVCPLVKAARRHGANVRTVWDINPFTRIWLLWRAARTGRI